MKISVLLARVALGLALGTALSGCATVVEGTKEKVTVRTVPPADANCLLRNREGQWHASAPGTVKVDRSSSPLQIDCEAPGYGPGHATAQAHFNGVTLGNVVLGGLVGIGIDAATGADHSYDDVTVPLGPPRVAEAHLAPRVETPEAPPAPPADTPDRGWPAAPPPPTATPEDSTGPAPMDEPPPWGMPPG